MCEEEWNYVFKLGVAILIYEYLFAIIVFENLFAKDSIHSLKTSNW